MNTNVSVEQLLFRKILDGIVRGESSNQALIRVRYGAGLSDIGTLDNGTYVLNFETPYFCVLEISQIGANNAVLYESYEWQPPPETLALGDKVMHAILPLLRDEFSAFYIDINNQMNFLVNFPRFETVDELGESIRWTRRLKEILLEACLLLEETEHVKLGGAVSSVCRGWEDIPRMFREARRLTAFQRTLDYEMRVVSYFDVANRCQTMEQKNEQKELERKYLMNVMSGNYLEAGDLLDQILDYYQYDSLPAVASFTHQVTSLITFALRSQFIDIYSDDYDEYGILSCAKAIQRKSSLSAVRVMIRSLFKNLATCAQGQNLQDNDKVQSLQRYIQDHFRDPNLSISSMSEALYISPQHLTKLLRQYTGLSALETIHSYRIEEAKRLLAQTEMTVKAIVETCGYDNQWTFFRTFKKREGITPGEYRSLARGGITGESAATDQNGGSDPE